MEIKNHKLVGENISYSPTRKTSGKYADGCPDTIIIHYTGGNNAEIAAKWLNKSNVRASAHMVVGREGQIIQLADLDTITWHAGKSRYKFPDKNRTTFNKYSIGIEIANDGYLRKSGNQYFNAFKGKVDAKYVFKGKHRNYPRTKSEYWHTYTDVQVKTVYDICRLIIKEYPSVKYILGHEEIAPVRKTDPGPAFPLDDLREKMGVWIPGTAAPQEKEIIKDKMPLGTVGVATAVLNFRAGAGQHYEKVAEQLQKGERVLIISKQGNWYEVEQEITGWVARKFIERDDSDSKYDGIVNASLLNIREKPDGAKIAKPLSKGHRVEILERDNDWVKVDTRVTGWVYNKYIKLEK